MIDGLIVKKLNKEEAEGQLTNIEVVVTGKITEEELASLEFCMRNDYIFALYAAPK